MADALPPRTPLIVRRTATLLGLLVVVLMVADGAVTLLDVAARASYTTNASYRSVDRLAIDLDQGSVELVRLPRGHRVTVRARITGGLVSPDITRRFSGGRLRLRSRCPGFLVISCGVRWRVGVPDGTRVSAAAYDGNVEVGTIRPRGGLTLRAIGGNIHVHGARVTTLDARSSDGNVSVDGVRAQRVRAQSSDGNVAVSVLAAPRSVVARSSDGNVRVTVPDVPYAIVARSSDGNTHVDAKDDSGSARTIDARSSDGNVRVTTPGGG